MNQQLVFKKIRDNSLSYTESIQELNLSEGTIEAHIRLALKSLTKALDEHFVLPIIIIMLAYSL